MPITLPEEKQRELPPSGTHGAVCSLVADLGTQPGGKYPARRQVLLSFELTDEARVDGNPFVVSRTFGFSSTAGSHLRAFLESWFGRSLTADDFGKMDLAERLGATCMLGIMHETRDDGRIFANISSVMAPAKGTPTRLPPRGPAMSFSLSDRPFDRETFEALPEWIRQKIAASPEYKDIINPAASLVSVEERLRARLASSASAPASPNPAEQLRDVSWLNS
jgi:hypothetical protein